MLSEWRAELNEAARPLRPGEDRQRPSWISAAYENPARFWTEIGPELIARAPGTPRSAVFEWYDLFYEFGARHAAGPHGAVVDYNPASGFRHFSYTRLTERATRLALRWQRQHAVMPGATVCIVLDIGPAYVACLLAAFACGAVVTIVPPQGPLFVRQAVVALGGNVSESLGKAAAPPQPAFVVMGESVAWLSGVGSVEPLPFNDEGSGVPAGLSSHRYEAGEVVARFFSPFGASLLEPVSLSAEQLYLGALRDGLLLLSLMPKDGVSAPGWCALSSKPSLLLACLAAGARWVEMSADELADGSDLLGGEVQVLGIDRALMRLLLQRKQLPRDSIRRWFRNMTNDEQPEAWEALQNKVLSIGGLGMNYLCNAAAGGSLFFSAWTQQVLSAGVWRAPGVPCELTEPNGTGMPSASDVGMLTPIEKCEDIRGVQSGLPVQAVGNMVITTTPRADVWIANLGSHRDGQFLPEALIETALRQRLDDALRAAVLVNLPRRHHARRGRVVLLVFVHPGAEVGSPAELKKLLETEIGEVRTPDSIEIYTLNPPLLDASDPTTVDRAACATQFASGVLWLKSRTQTFEQLARLTLEAQEVRAYAEFQAQNGAT